MAESTKAWAVAPKRGAAAPPADLEPVVNWLEEQSDARERFRWALRDSMDELLDGQRTGRWCYQQLSKTEHSHLGTIVEINLTKEFAIRAGRDLDWRIRGIDVDCKFSKDLGGWEIPMEMYLCAEHGDRSGNADHPAIVVWMDDDTSTWAVGIVRITDERLRFRRQGGDRAYNRDNKRAIADATIPDIYWLWSGLQKDLPTNLLLHLDPAVRSRILIGRSGQARVNNLFQEVTGRLVGRQTVLTVAQQEDAPKRARDARLALRPEGYIVLGHEPAHRRIAAGLGLPEPVKGEWVSTRVVKADLSWAGPRVEITGDFWRTARPEDPTNHGPALPRAGSGEA